MRLARCSNGHMFNTRKYGNVCPYCDISVETLGSMTGIDLQKDEESKITPIWDQYEDLEPVVGWIVCIEGSVIGQDYKIISEKNFIGRADDMHIQIAGDNTISRRNHGTIIYDPKRRNFIITSGDSSGLVYLNNEAVYSPQELSAYDVIQMGKSKFIFIPLCGIHFDWDNEHDEYQDESE